MNKKILFAVLIIFTMGAVVLLSIRLLSGEDDWICVNGAWVKHGAPKNPPPAEGCVRAENILQP